MYINIYTKHTKSMQTQQKKPLSRYFPDNVMKEYYSKGVGTENKSLEEFANGIDCIYNYLKLEKRMRTLHRIMEKKRIMEAIKPSTLLYKMLWKTSTNTQPKTQPQIPIQNKTFYTNK